MLSVRMKAARKAHKLTQEQLAIKVKTTKGTISNYENGHSTPSNEMLVDLADALNTSIDYLLGRTENPEFNPVNNSDDYREKAKQILEDSNKQIAARDGEISESEALERIARILEKQKGRLPGQRQPRPRKK
ncbi:helix-turn-helix domain-containing protein [Bacillus massiliigorillae]|uniref:helix-turn-helix domain-containing protein n=1 Tax=Bacillus massiliigorillae TaxID=1243664 RepID=UPI0003A8BA54|nr:helix-turn-helix transcriptional regulator [Bacillus massiliigorillae]